MRPIVYVDIDDTLVRSFGSKRIAMSHTVDRVREAASVDAVSLTERVQACR